MTVQINIQLTVTFIEEVRMVCECGNEKCDAEVQVERIKRQYKSKLTYCKCRKEGKRGYVVRYGHKVTRTESIWGRPGFGGEPGFGVTKIYRFREKKKPRQQVSKSQFIAEQFKFKQFNN